ncbi:MAG: glutamate dehydrogenase, partial [Bacteroidetes bacterium]
MNLNKIMNDLEKKHPGENEYLQAVREVLESIEEVVNENPHFQSAGIIERIVEPDRVLMFKVP